MKTRMLVFYALLFLIAGCIPVISLHPLYEEKDLIFEKNLIGTWVDDSNDVWSFACPNEPQKLYTLNYRSHSGGQGLFDVYLLKLENKLFLDITPAKLATEKDLEKMQWGLNLFLFAPGHTFAKIDELGPELKMRFTIEDEFKKFLAKEPNSVKYEKIENKPILTASTKELQKFFIKYADDKQIFHVEVNLKRKISEPNDPNIPAKKAK